MHSIDEGTYLYRSIETFILVASNSSIFIIITSSENIATFCCKKFHTSFLPLRQTGNYFTRKRQLGVSQSVCYLLLYYIIRMVCYIFHMLAYLILRVYIHIRKIRACRVTKIRTRIEYTRMALNTHAIEISKLPHSHTHTHVCIFRIAFNVN